MKNEKIFREKNFDLPTLQVITFETKDIITTSDKKYNDEAGEQALPEFSIFG